MDQNVRSQLFLLPCLCSMIMDSETAGPIYLMFSFINCLVRVSFYSDRNVTRQRAKKVTWASGPGYDVHG